MMAVGFEGEIAISGSALETIADHPFQESIVSPQVGWKAFSNFNDVGKGGNTKFQTVPYLARTEIQTCRQDAFPDYQVSRA